MCMCVCVCVCVWCVCVCVCVCTDCIHVLCSQETKVFIGLGFPYEGPAPLEAIAKGCYFLNPVLNPPLNRDNSKFFKAKPTLRALTSQNPYTEEFIRDPHVFTVNIDNLESVKAVMEVIANKPVYIYTMYIM